MALNGLGAAGHISLGAALLKSGKPDEAMASLERAAELEPRNAAGRQQQAAVWIARGDMVKAEAVLREAIALDPANWKLPNDFSILLNRLGRYQEAAEVLEQQNRATPDNGVILVNLGVIYHTLGRDQEAATAIQRSMEIRPSQRGYSNLARCSSTWAATTARSRHSNRRCRSTPTPIRPGATWATRTAGRQASASRPARCTSVPVSRSIRRSPATRTIPPCWRSATYHAKRGDISAARTLLDKIDLTKADVPSPILFKAAVVEEISGARARALAMLEAALRRGYSPDEVGADPELLDLRKDPDYHKLVARLTTPGK